jgi:hypothetical protein
MERRILTDDERSLLRALLNERIARDQTGDYWTADQCRRVLGKIEGVGKTVVIESAVRDEIDEAERRAVETGCG